MVSSTEAGARRDHRSSNPAAPWVPWVLGVAALAAVIVVSLHVSEGREFLRLLERARPAWLALAVVLQGATYLAQAEVFAVVPRQSGKRLARLWLYQLSLTKLFLDQALPPAGISSAVVVAQALERRGVSRGAVAAGAVISIASYHVAYVVALLVALALTARRLHAHLVVLVLSAIFVGLATAVTVIVLKLSGRSAKRAGWLGRLPMIHRVVEFLEDAERRLARSPRLIGEATAWQIAIFLLDAATIWTLIRALGETAPGTMVFASFMISTLVRTLGIVPGGLGTYEAASVVTLRMIGVSVPVALSATLIFRGLSFWLPMVPGLLSSRRVTRSHARGRK
jgi:Mg2+-importing ATPase